MSVSLFCENLGAFPADRTKALDARLRAEGLSGLEALYVLVWPDYEPPNPPRPQDNRAAFDAYRQASGVPLWAWFNARADQAADAAAIATLEPELDPAGWKLDIEGEWTKGAKLSTLIAGAKATGKPLSASLAAITASHAEYDYRGLDNADIEVDWQAYFDSLEGPDPAPAVAELYQSRFVLAGWEYRHRLGSVYGWGKVISTNVPRARFDSYKRPGSSDASFEVGARQWGATVVDRTLRRDGVEVGLLMGRARYDKIRGTLDVTRGAPGKHSLDEWTKIATSSRFPKSRKHPISIYLASKNVSNNVIVTIARGAA